MSQSALEEPIGELLVSNLLEQLSEFETLKSIYPGPQEITTTDSKILDKIQAFVESKSEYVPPHLDYVVHLNINGSKVELCVNLPSLYPQSEPDIFVRCNQLNRLQESKLNKALSDTLADIFNKEPCIYTVISFLQENFILHTQNTDKEEKESEIKSKIIDDKFVRYWIHSHHIYNKKKRDEILSKAKELKLNGFCLPGKPGVICVEGKESSCKEWWKIIKSMTWQKIGIRKTEEFKASEEHTQKKFDSFNEIYFPNNSTGQQNKHTDMSDFLKFLESHKLSYVFNEIVGLNSSSND